MFKSISKLFAILLLFAVVLSACSPQGGTLNPTDVASTIDELEDALATEQAPEPTVAPTDVPEATATEDITALCVPYHFNRMQFAYTQGYDISDPKMPAAISVDCYRLNIVWSDGSWLLGNLNWNGTELEECVMQIAGRSQNFSCFLILANPDANFLHARGRIYNKDNEPVGWLCLAETVDSYGGGC